MDYTASIAPKGREGAYFSISTLSYSIGFMVAGISAALVLEPFCPEDGERDCWKVWVIYSGVSVTGVIALFLSRKWLEQPTTEVNPYVPWSDEAKNN